MCFWHNVQNLVLLLSFLALPRFIFQMLAVDLSEFAGFYKWLDQISFFWYRYLKTWITPSLCFFSEINRLGSFCCSSLSRVFMSVFPLPPPPASSDCFFYDIFCNTAGWKKREVYWGSKERGRLEARTVSKLVEWECQENVVSVSELLHSVPLEDLWTCSVWPVCILSSLSCCFIPESILKYGA